MQTKIHNMTNQKVRKSNLTHQAIGKYNYQFGYGSLDIFDKSGAALLLYIFMYGAAKGEIKDDIKKGFFFCVPTEKIAWYLSLSERQIQKCLVTLEENKMIEDTGERRDRHKVFKMRMYDAKKDYAIPAIIAVTKSIPLSLKIFILKLQFLMPASEKAVYTFKNNRELRVISSNHDVVVKNLTLLEERGLISQDNKGNNVINIHEVYEYLHMEYINSSLKNINLY